jgi:hypothetical protein
MIDYEYFLSRRFDLVTRYHILRESDFSRHKARTLINEKRHSDLKSIFSTLLRLGTKVHLVEENLFPAKNWHWLENKIKKNQRWINKNPYPVKLDLIGGSVKRFLISLIHKKPLPWIFLPAKREFKNLWKEETYKKMLKAAEFSDIKNSQEAMMKNMRELNFFSLDTYRGEEVLLEEYKAYIQTQEI